MATVVVIPLTSKQDALRFPATLLIEPSAANGLKVLSVALVFQITAIDQGFLSGQIGKLGNEEIAAIRQELNALTGDDAT